jgi:hypothetical protein
MIIFCLQIFHAVTSFECLYSQSCIRFSSSPRPSCRGFSTCVMVFGNSVTRPSLVKTVHNTEKSQDTTFSIVTRLRARQPRNLSSIPGRGKRFPFTTDSWPAIGAYLTSYAMDTGSRGVKGPWRETDHPPPSSVKDNNAWIYTSTPLMHLHAVVLN